MSRKASGLKAWAIQRGTALYLAAFFVFVLAKLGADPLPDYAAWRAWVADPVVSLAGLVFFAALLIHAWIGVRDILMDYVSHAGARVAALALVALVLVGSGLWAVQILFLARVV